MADYEASVKRMLMSSYGYPEADADRVIRDWEDLIATSGKSGRAPRFTANQVASLDQGVSPSKRFAWNVGDTLAAGARKVASGVRGAAEWSGKKLHDWQSSRARRG